MKKALKITGITLAILVGLLIVVTGITIAVITSSGRLTKILNHYAPQVVNCETKLGNASLTLVKTFPNIGLEIEHVALINPMEGSPSDTLANIDDVTLVLDIKKLLRQKKIEVSQCVLDRAFVNIYTDAEGNSNLNVFNTKEDTDTISDPFDYHVDLQEISFKNSTAYITDDRDVLTIQVKDFDMDLNGNYKDNDIHTELNMKVDDLYILNYAAPFELTNVNLCFNGDIKQLEQIEGILSVDKPDVHLNTKEPIQNDTLSIMLPILFSLKDLSGRYDQGQARLKDYRIDIDGGVEIADNGELIFDFGLKSNTAPLDEVLSYLPKDTQKTLNPNGSKDKVNLALAKGKVSINSSKLPHVLIGIKANDLAFHTASLPHPLLNLKGDILLDTDLTKKKSDRIQIHGLTTNFKESNMSIKGLVDDFNNGILIKLDVKGDVLITDIKNILPKKTKLKGRVNFDLNTDFTIDALRKTLEDFDLRRLWSKAKLKIKYVPASSKQKENK